MSAIANDPLHHLGKTPSVHNGPVIVACDGAPASQESLFNAARLAGRTFGAAIEILGVCEPTPAVAGGMDVIPAPVELDDMRRCLLYTSPSPRDRTRSRMPSSA